MHTYDKAVAEYEKVLKMQPSNVEAPLYLGAVWSEQKQYEKAVKSFEALAKNPDYTTPHLAWYYIGRVRMDQKEDRALKAAEKAFRKALDFPGRVRVEQSRTRLPLLHRAARGATWLNQIGRAHV